MDQLHTRLEALEQRTQTVARQLRWWPGPAGGLLVLAVLTWALPAGTAPEGMKRTVLHQVDLTGASGMEVISGILEVPPGATIPRHFHHGIEAAYVIAGAMIQDPGKEPRMLPTGANVFNLREVPHAGFTVVGETALKVYTVHVVDKGKPLFDEGK
jgi:quercetin dioxygenase-like cupin family protein